MLTREDSSSFSTIQLRLVSWALVGLLFFWLGDLVNVNSSKAISHYITLSYCTKLSSSFIRAITAGEARKTVHRLNFDELAPIFGVFKDELVM
jgi:hypothetical protein